MKNIVMIQIQIKHIVRLIQRIHKNIARLGHWEEFLEINIILLILLDHIDKLMDEVESISIYLDFESPGQSLSQISKHLKSLHQVAHVEKLLPNSQLAIDQVTERLEGTVRKKLKQIQQEFSAGMRHTTTTTDADVEMTGLTPKKTKNE